MDQVAFHGTDPWAFRRGSSLLVHIPTVVRPIVLSRGLADSLVVVVCISLAGISDFC